jgi:hypothetical protein
MKDQIIQGIESLYPIDAQFEDTAKVGEILLMSAFRVSGFNWRDLPENVLSVYLSLCKKEDESGSISKELKEYGAL